MTPFDGTNKILGPYGFGPNVRETLDDNKELYFYGHSFVPLFIQENHLKTQPVKVRNLEGPPKILKQFELMDQAVSSISDADLVDALIHGTTLVVDASTYMPHVRWYGPLHSYSVQAADMAVIYCGLIMIDSSRRAGLF